MVCWKLVRDRVGEEVSGSPGVVVERVSGERLERLLRVKVVEEAVEFALSGSVEEVADLLEALREWARVRGLDWGLVERVVEEKRRRRGGFSGGFLVYWVDRGVC